MISYAPLWETLKEKNLTQYQLIKDYHVSTGTLDSLRKNKCVTTNTLNDLCIILNCGLESIVEFIPQATNTSKNQ